MTTETAPGGARGKFSDGRPGGPEGGPKPPPPDPDRRAAAAEDETAERISRILEASRRMGERMIARAGDYQVPDAGVISRAFVKLGAQIAHDPAPVMQATLGLWTDGLKIWDRTARRMLGEETPDDPVAAPASDDRRFKDDAWTADPAYDFMKQWYLAATRWTEAALERVDGLDDPTRRKVRFYTRQYVDALAPTNFPWSNPEVVRATLDSGGENLLKGMENMLADLERGDGALRIRMTDESAFDLGVNVATTPGKVVMRTDLAELIQYAPTTETVHKVPILICPPWINKYYILDLRPKNSLVKWLTDQGFTVFILSWINPDATLAQKGFEDYMTDGPLAAFEAIAKATGEKKVHAVGYCIGGTLMASTLAVLRSRRKAPAVTATFLTTMLDFAEPGELGVFIDDEQLDLMDAEMAAKGFLDGRHMAQVFSMLRDNDLIWSFVVNNYLLGKDPFPFDLLYWNGDSTRMPAMMHRFYLRNMYRDNRLCVPNGIALDGTDVDLGRIDVPTYFLSTREDHIAPWKSTYAGTQLVKGPVRFVLAASGHIAGVVNPPAGGKYCFWSRDDGKRPDPDPEAWLAGADRTGGSWWPDWAAWLKARGGDAEVPARAPGDGKLPILGDAPGTYVRVRAEDTGPDR